MSEGDRILVELDRARVVRDGRVALDVEHLALREGEHVAVLGPNGAGKSTLIKVITRDLRPLALDDGTPVRFLGRERWDLFEARRVFGAVSNDLQTSYARGIDVRDAVTSGFFGSVGLYRRDEVTPEMAARVTGLLDELEIGHLADRLMRTLSTGEARRALIARALVHDPALLVLDEPCDGLDPHAAYHVRRAISRLAASGHTLLLVTHHVEDIVPEIGRVVMLRDGGVYRDGPKRELMSDEAIADLFDIPARIEQREGWYRLW